ncbi:hypothetical protein F4774DRAFT_423848 [Daldinia eschscholtzii]|nr:hypothetical protein F4774DRAFT_423848 [Daldinia eschscholtzii]
MSVTKWTPGSTGRTLTPSAPTFIPVDIKASNEVLDATFVTHTIPDISPDSGVVGLCAVPHERAGKHDLGWHIADFLAFKALLCGETHPKAQTWLSQCDIASMVKDNPDDYAHGEDRRLVSVAAAASSYTDGYRNLLKRDDDIKVEPSAEKLMEDFLATLAQKSKIAKENGLPLIIVICGLTTAEQDVFFGETDPRIRLTSGKMREVLEDHTEVTIITPALFSAGWLINPSFCESPARKVCAYRTDFLARQFGAIFAKDLVDHFLSWSCPYIDWDQLGNDEKDGTYPGPAKLSKEQQDAIEAFKVKIHNVLAGRLSSGHTNHSFNFEVGNDDWQKLVGPRKHKSLSYFKQKWEKLGVSTGATTNEPRLEFLGSAFGGNKASQERHIKHIVYDSFAAWPGYWALPFGRSARAAFHMFIGNENPDYRDCHEIFNIMEHRSTSAVVADMALKYFGIPRPYEERCRDWDELKWINESTDTTHLAVNRLFGEVSQYIPEVNVPPGVNPNPLSVIQRRLEVPASYLSVAIHNYSLARPRPTQTIVNRIATFFQEVKSRQTELLFKDLEMYEKCSAWLSSINLPIRPRDHIVPPKESTEAAQESTSVSSWSPPTSGIQKLTLDPFVAVESRGEVSEAVSRPPSKAESRLDALADNLPSDMKQLLPDVDMQLGIRTLMQERDNLVIELMNSPPEKLLEIREKMAENQELLVFMERLAREKETKSEKSSYGSEKNTKTVSSSTRQDTSSIHGSKRTPQQSRARKVYTPDQGSRRHLRRSWREVDEEDEARIGTEARNLPEEVKEMLKVRPEWPPLNSPKEAKPSPSTQPATKKKESEVKAQSNVWIPPHLRGLPHPNI